MPMSLHPYPGNPISRKSSPSEIIRAIQKVLKTIGLDDGLKSGVFDSVMESAVRLFQSQNVDSAGHALKVDGIVGAFTWAALFGVQPFTASDKPIASLPALSLATAISQIGIMENLGQPNRGPEVDAYLREAGIKNPAANKQNGGYPWCQAFLYWCLVRASESLGRSIPAPRTAGVLEHWNLATPKTNIRRISKSAALSNSDVIQVGMIFVNDYGNGYGHIGFVERVYSDGRLGTVEGNTNSEANREGLGVFRLQRRKLNDKELKGFLDYAEA